MSVDVDDTIALDSALNQSIDKKIFMETPGSFSMSSWSQVLHVQCTIN